MFYILEIYWRFKYLLIAIIFFINVCYFYEQELFQICFYLNIFSIKTEKMLDHYIYTNPLEIFNIYLQICVILLWYFIIPYFIYILGDFLKPAVYQFEYKKFQKFFIHIYSVLYLFNFCAFYFLLPIFWLYLENFNGTSFLINENITFELKIADYYSFLFNFFISFNLFLLLWLTFFTFLKKKNLINIKNFYLIINLVFFLGLPLDLIFQCLGAIFIYLLIELIIFFFIFFYKIKKFLKFKKELHSLN